MNTIFNTELSEDDFNNNKYKFQPELTKYLDQFDDNFDQDIINQIVLWKVNRYSKLKLETLSLLNQIKKTDTTIDIDLTKKILRELLNTHGIKLAMASTILRFKNPNLYQIIDQRVFRFIYPNKDLSKITTKIDEQIDIYFEYLEDLRNICKSKNVNFYLSDRIFYVLDKERNKKYKLNG